MELRKGLKVMKRKTVISLIIATILVVSLITAIVFTQSEKAMLLKEAKQELKRAMNYDEFEEGEENVEGTDNVKFSAFFLRDLNADGYAEKIKGTCKPIGSEDTLYMELNVLTAGYLKDAKVEINGKNFYLQTALPKDNELKNNYIGNNIKIIEFNNIVNGTQKLFSGIVRSGDYSYSSGKTAAIGNNIANYSREDNTITFSGTYVAEDGTETRIIKIVPIIMDWYGSVNATIGSTTQNHYDLDNRIDEENNSLVLDFTVNVSETQNKLILSKNYVEGEIPELNGFAPTYVGLENSQGLTFNHDEKTRRFTIERLATLNENLVTKTVARSSSYKFQVVYPYEAYEDNFGDTITLKIPVKTYFEGYNNPNTEFENPYVSNTAKATITAKFEKERTEEQIKVSRVDVTVGKSVTSPTKRNIVSKLKPLNIYNGVSETEDNDTYEVRWNVYVGTKDDGKNIKLMESKVDSLVQVSDTFIKNDSSEISMESFVTNTGIYFINAQNAIADDGFIKVYDVENNNVLATFTKDMLNSYTANNVFYYDFPVKHVRIETSEVIGENEFSIVHVKEINDELLTTTYTLEEFDELVYIETTLEAYMDDKDVGTKNSIAVYEAPYSSVNWSISKNLFSTQVVEKNVNVVINAEYNKNYNQVAWNNGTFFIKVPKEIVNVKINSIETNNPNIMILSYEYNMLEDGSYIKINTKNIDSKEDKFSINLNIDIASDPRENTKDIKFELYSANENISHYYYYAIDKYDINNNLNTQEKVGKIEKNISIIAPNTLITNQIISDYDDEASFVISPQIAEISRKYVELEEGFNSAKIGIQIKNNYENTISEINILGRIPTVGNNTVLSDLELNSDFSVTMMEQGIEIPEELKDKVKVYYSEKINATNDILNENNGWISAENIVDFSNIKSFLIDFEDNLLDKEKEYIFYYKVNIPNDVELNKIAFAHHGVYFCLDTSEGKYRTQTEPSEIGIKTVEKFNIELVKYQKGKNKKVSGATYIINEIINNEEIINFKTGITENEGKLLITDLYAEKVYEIKELKSPENYELNDEIIRFVTHVDETGKLYFEKIFGNIRNDVEVFQNEKKVIINVEDEVKAKLKIIKEEKDTNVKIPYVKFRIYGKGLPLDGKIITTNLNGEILLDGLHINEEYVLNEIRADGYYINESIKFKLLNNDGIYQIEIISGDVYFDYISEEDDIPTLNLIIQNEKKPTFNLIICKIKRNLETEIVSNIVSNSTTEENEIIYLPGAKFKLYEGNEEIGSYETDANGVIYIEKLYEYQEEKNEEIVYTLRETDAPEGYSKVKDISFKVRRENGILKFENSEGIEEKYEVEDDNIKLFLEDPPSFKLIKKDAETKEVLRGIKFAIYNVESGIIPAVDSKGNVLGKKELINGKEYYVLETDKNGEIIIDLPEGIYKLIELKAPDKYNIENNVFYFGIGMNVQGKNGFKPKESILIGEYISTLDRTSDKGYIAGGYFKKNKLELSPDIILDGSSSNNHSMIIKYSDNLDIEWARTLAPEFTDIIIKIIQTNDDGYMVAGYFTGSTLTLDDEHILSGESGVEKGFVIKYDYNWNVEWAKIIGSRMNAITKTKDGGYIYAGRFHNTLNLENNISVTSTGESDAIILKYSKENQLEWFRTYNGTSSEGINGIVELENGEIIVLANTTSSVIDVGDGINLDTGTTSLKNVIVKHSSDGRPILIKKHNGTVTSITKSDNNSFTICGYFTAITMDIDNKKIAGSYSSSNNSTDSDGMIIKYDAECNPIWISPIGKTRSSEYLYSLCQDENNDYLISGNFATNLILNRDFKISGYSLLKIEPTKVADCIIGDYILKMASIENSFNVVKDTSDNGYIAAGYFNGNNYELENGEIIPGNGMKDGIIIKYNYLNEIEWYKSFGGDGNEEVLDIDIIGDDLFLTCTYASDFSLDNKINCFSNGLDDVLVLKMDLNGNIKWYDSFGGSQSEKISKIVATSDGGCIAVGNYYSSGIYIDKDIILNNRGSNDGLIIKYDENGNVKWVKTTNGGSLDCINDVTEMKDKGYVVVGHTYGTYSIDLGNGYIIPSDVYDRKSFAIKFDKDGNTQWFKQCVTGWNGDIYGVVEANDGGVFLVGYYTSSGLTIGDGISIASKSGGNLVGNYSAYSDGMLIKLSEDGKVEWAESLGGCYSDNIDKIISTSDGGFIIGGKFGSTRVDFGNGVKVEKYDNNRNHQMIVKYDSIGNAEWAQSFNDGVILKSIDETKDGEVIIAGRTSTNIVVGNETAINKDAGIDSFMIKMNTRMQSPEIQVLNIENDRKEFIINTKVVEVDGYKGGKISGENYKIYETVKYGDTSTKDILIEPDENYEIISIKINDVEYEYNANQDGKVLIEKFVDMNEDKFIEVKFSLKTNKVVINKVDSETNDGLKGVEFRLDQIEEREELNKEGLSTVANGDNYYTKNIQDLQNECLGGLVGNSKYYNIEQNLDDNFNYLLGEMVNNGNYYFVENEGKMIPTNGKEYQLMNGRNSGISNTTAHSYIPIDLTSVDGKYVVTVNAEVSSETNYDYGFARITENNIALAYNNSEGRFFNISGKNEAKDYNSNVLEGGKVYYLHFGYRKDKNTDNNSDTVRINDINLYSVKFDTYNIVINNSVYESTNKGVHGTVSSGYIPIDLTNKTGKFLVDVDAEISSESNRDYGYVIINGSTVQPQYNSSYGRVLLISGNTSGRYTSTELEGGKKYYLHIGYYKDSSNNIGTDTFKVKSVNVYGTTVNTYYFENKDGKIVSNNQYKNNTVARSYIPIDLTNCVGTYNLIINAELSSQSSYSNGYDIGYVNITENTNKVDYNDSTGRIMYLSSVVNAKDYVKKLETGKMYYLHLGYFKNDTSSGGKDTFQINSIRIVPNYEDMYHVNVVTNNSGRAITQIPYGKYAITEINTPEGYEPLDSSVIIEFRENGEKEFTIENKKFAKVIVHHYKAEVDIARNGYTYTEEKLAEDEVYMDRTGYPYKTSPKLDLGEYSLITDALGEYILPENATGQYNGVIEVNYYYSASKIPLRVQHIIEGTEDRVELATGEKSEDNISFGKLGESYETAPLPKEELHEKYEVIGSTDNASGTYEYSDIVVNYYYKIKEFDVTTGVKMKTQTDILGNESVVAGGTILGANEGVYETVLYGEDSTKDIVATPDEGYYVETLTINDEPIEFTPDENGVVRLANFSNMREDKMVMVGFAQDKGKVTVHHKLQDVDEYVPSIEDGKTVEPEIKEGDIGKPFATKPSDKVALRYEAKSNTEPSSGVYTLEDQEVTYYYGYKDFEYKIEYYYNGVLDETKTENGIATWGTVIDTYADKVEYGYELGEVENYPLTVSEYVENNIIKVNYEPKDTSLIVKYVDKHTGEEIAERKTVPGKMFEKHDLTEDIIDIEGYTFLEIPEPIIVDTSLEVKEYIIYYAANTKVTINYLDKADGKILETIIIEGKVDDPYEAYAKDFDKYVLDTKPENETGIMTREEIVLNYYYIYVSDGVIEKHIDLRTDKLLDSSYYTGMEGDPYTTDKKEFVGYDILTNKQYYKEFIKEQFTEDEVLELLKEYNLETEDELFEKYTEDLILKVLKEKGLNADDEYIPENKDGFMEKGVIEVKYYYVRKTKVIVEYIDKQTGKPVQVETKVDLDGDGVIDEVRVADAIEIIEGHEGDKYETIAKEFDGYILQKDEEGNGVIPENAIGEMTKEDIFVRYEYIKKAKVIEKHIDVKTGILIENVIVHEGYVGKEYDIKSKEFDKYHVVEDKLPINSKGTMIDGDIIVEYYYIHEGKVIIEYLDKYSGERLQEKVEKDLNDDLIIDDSEFELVDSTVIIEGLEGDEYTSSAKEFEKYKLVETELPSNGSGTMTKEDITVKYYYVKESVGVREEHRDSSTNELLEESIMHPGYEGDSYKINSKEFNNYDLDSDKLPKNSEGKMTKEEIVVTYYYKRKTEVIVKYVNDETGEELLEEIVIKGHVGDTYTTEEKVIDGYTLVKISSNREGKMDKNVIVVTYYYVKAPDVIHKPEEPEVPKVPNVPEVQEQPKEDADHVVIGNTVTVNNQVVNIISNTVITANTVTNTTNTTNTIVSNTVKNEDYNKDEEVETPKTGDNTPIVLVIGCMVVLLLNTMYVLASTNKKQKPKNIIIVGKDKKKQK